MSGTLTGYENATGVIDYTLTNNYMFHIILQENAPVLKGLISSLLRLPFDDINSVIIKNPIIPGAAMDMKEFILDLCITLNNNTELNLEMQVNNLYNWTDRSLSYLCRTFDNLYRGMDYGLVKPAIHIGILDYTLFPETPEFYATYMMLNVKNHQVFNDKFILSVLSLRQIEQATSADKEWGLDTWARFFAAKTWRDLKMIAENNEILTSASKSLYEYNANWHVREQCRAREDFENRERNMQQLLIQANQSLSQKVQELVDTEQKLFKKNQELAEKNKALATKDQELATKDQELATKDQELATKDARIRELEALLKRQNKEV